jgi:glycine cleavage system H protein
MEYPKELKYTKEHEWVRVEGDIAVVGVTDYAQHALGDVVFVELPKMGDHLQKDKAAAVVESVKSVSDVFAPVCGDVVGSNDKVSNAPELINKSPYKDGWMFKVKIDDKKELSGLMNAQEYEKLVGGKK